MNFANEFLLMRKRFKPQQNQTKQLKQLTHMAEQLIVAPKK